MAWLLTLHIPIDQIESTSTWLWQNDTTGIFERPVDAANVDLVAGFDLRSTADKLGEAPPPGCTVVGVSQAPPVERWVDADQIVEIELSAGRRLALRPGAAFGHGSHPSTRAALDLLDRHSGDRHEGSPGNRAALDLGCGTGVLSIAALMLGIDQVTALDIDRNAVEQTLANLTALDLDSRATVIQGDVSVLAERRSNSTDDVGYDLIMVNVLLPVHRSVAQTVVDLLNPTGEIVTAGYLADQEDDVLASYGCPLVTDSHKLDDWVGHRFHLPGLSR